MFLSYYSHSGTNEMASKLHMCIKFYLLLFSYPFLPVIAHKKVGGQFRFIHINSPLRHAEAHIPHVTLIHIPIGFVWPLDDNHRKIRLNLFL